MLALRSAFPFSDFHCYWRAGGLTVTDGGCFVTLLSSPDWISNYWLLSSRQTTLLCYFKPLPLGSLAAMAVSDTESCCHLQLAQMPLRLDEWHFYESSQNSNSLNEDMKMHLIRQTEGMNKICNQFLVCFAIGWVVFLVCYRGQCNKRQTFQTIWKVFFSLC